MDGTILIADDDRTIRTVLTQALTRAGCRVHATSSLMTLMRWVEEGRGDLVISDVVMPDGNGLETLPKITAARPTLPVIVISAQNTIMTAIQAAEADAYDYLPKPFDLPDLMKRVARALGRKQKAAIAPGTSQDADNLPLVGRTASMQALYRLIARVMNTDIPVLVTGESGTGKSLIARSIHDLSDRRNMPFTVVSSADLVGGDAASTILSRARSGTLLFDEVGDLDAMAQTRVVRMLDDLGDNVPRIMATSRKDLASAIENRDFREDLYFRLAGTTLTAPSLRDRIDDLPLLAEHFLARSERDGGTQRALSPQSLALLRTYSWPGNVRQLENTIRQLSVTGSEPEIAATEVEMALSGQPAADPLQTSSEGDRLGASVARHLQRYFDMHGGVLPPAGVYQRILREVEVPLLGIALDATGGNQAKCADLLGINRNTLRKKLTELDIRVTRRRKLM
jgi:two-component system, NtrC family, nitrogen regulation response regulator GlnG